MPGVERGTRASARKAPPARCGLCAGLPPQSVRKDRSTPSSPYSFPPAATGHFRSRAFPSVASAASTRRCRRTSHHSKYSPRPAHPERSLPHFIGKNRFIADKYSEPLASGIERRARRTSLKLSHFFRQPSGKREHLWKRQIFTKGHEMHFVVASNPLALRTDQRQRS